MRLYKAKPKLKSYKAMRDWLYKEYKHRDLQLTRYSVEHIMYLPEVRLLAEMFSVKEINVASDIVRMAWKESEM
jgi:hypothetical protein